MCLYGEIKPKLTRSQRALCEAIGIGWLARNKVECSLRWYSEKPKRYMSDGCYKSSGTERIIGVPFPEFPFVKWENEPYSIEEMLKWEVDGVDTIYRQTAIEAVSNLASSMSVCLNIDECHGMKRMQEMAVMVLSRLQSAESEQVRASVSLADCISKQAAIHAAIEAVDEWDGGYNLARADKIISAIKKLPSAEPERKRGYWKPVTMSQATGYDPRLSKSDPLYGYECSVCGSENLVNDIGENVLTNYCPDCGADLREEIVMGDLISREAVLEFEEYVGERATWDKPYPKGDLYVKSEIIERIPAVEPEPQWISVSNKLPDSQTEVIVSIIDASGDTAFDYTTTGWLTSNKETWVVDDEEHHDVVAWMPLPKPCKVGGIE